MPSENFKNFGPLPASPEGEQAVLGSLMLNNEQASEIVEFLTPDDFYEESNRIIFVAIQRLVVRGEAVDLLTLANKLGEVGYLEKVGGVSYLASIVNEVPTVSNGMHYAKLIRKKTVLRKTIEQASKILEVGFSEPENLQGFLESSSEKIEGLSKSYQASTGTSKSESPVVPMLEAVEAMAKKDGESDKFPIGFNVFSEVMAVGTKNGGVMDGDLVVISGKSGHGKTTFAQTVSYHLAKDLGLPQLWFSYEMQITEIWEKFKAMGMPQDFLGYCPLKLESGNVDFIERKINEGIEKHNVKVVFIDHLGFLTPKVNERNAKDFEWNYSAYLGQLVRQLKIMAIEKKIIIFLLAHVRKTKEELDIDDIAHSVGIAQEADFVFMVERERLPGPKTPARQYKSNDNSLVGDEPSPLYTHGNVFSKYSRVLLVKNRRTGISKYLRCELINGRLQEAKTVEQILQERMVDDGEIMLG